MICECGHDEEQHGPVGADRLCSACLCDRFQEVTPDIGIHAGSGSVRTTLERALDKVQKMQARHDDRVVGDECTWDWANEAHAFITKALALLSDLERDHEATKALLRKALGWEGIMNAAEQSLMQGHRRDALDQQNVVTRERNEAKLILGSKESGE